MVEGDSNKMDSLNTHTYTQSSTYHTHSQHVLPNNHSRNSQSVGGANCPKSGIGKCHYPQPANSTNL